MSRTCTICRHPKRGEIDQSLLAGEPFRKIAHRSGTSSTALFRHNSQHVPKSLLLAKAAGEETQAGTLYERLKAVNRETLDILREARASNNLVIALAAISRVEKQLELEAKLLGQMDDSTKIAVGINIVPQKATDYSEVPLERLLQARDFMLKAQAILAGEAHASADVVIDLPLEGSKERPLPPAGIQSAKPAIASVLLLPVPNENGGRATSPKLEKRWNNWNE